MPSPDRVALAHERLAARARRIRLIRQRIVAGTLTAFVLAWGVVMFDGSMGEPASTAAAQVSSTATATSSADTSTPSSTDSSSDDSAATMTTSQS